MNRHEATWLYCNDGLVLADGETGQLLDANPQAERLLGRSLAEIKTLRFTDLHPTDQLPRARQAFAQPGMMVSHDVLRPDGSRVPVYISVGTFRDEQGRLITIGSFRDDSDHQTAKNALLRSNWALSAIRRANAATVTAQSDTEMMRLVCDGILSDTFVLAWIGLANQDEEKSVSVVAVSGRTAYLEGVNISWDDVPNGNGPTGRAIRFAKTQVNNFALVNPAFKPWAERVSRNGIESSLAAPLLREGKAFGAITIYSNQPDAFGSDVVRLFEDLARDIVFALDAKRALVAVTESERQYRLLFNNMRDGFAHCLMHYQDGIPVDFTYLNVNPSFYRLTGLTDVIGKRVSEVIPGLRKSNPELFEIYGRVAQTGISEIFEANIAALDSWFSVSVYSTEKEHFIAIFDNITDRKKVEEKLLFLAHHDPLTSLPNRLAIRAQFEQAKGHSQGRRNRVALVFLDIDNFKFINDTLGHVVGDLLLQQVALRLHACVCTADTVSRQGGDEFLIILPVIHSVADITSVAAKILENLAVPFMIDGRELSSSASLGVAIFPEDGHDFDTLLRKADTAMYYAKEAGRNSIRFFDKKMNVDAEERLAMRNELRLALDRGEFVLYYQPQIDLASGAVIGVEVLIRWNHPRMGLLAPGRFISIAEENGLIVPIGEWVLHEACRQMVAWQKAGLADMVIAVNLSAVQFKRSGLENTVMDALLASGLKPALLELELTESVLIGDTENVFVTIQHLKTYGVKLSIDDFGTGYSSLTYLKRFAVDKLKIDQSFVRGLGSDRGDEAIVRAIIQMAHGLGLSVIAEGVEDGPVLALLQAFQCNEAQGFHIAHPMCAEDFFTFAQGRRHL